MSCEGTLEGLQNARDWLSISESIMMSMRKSKTKIDGERGGKRGSKERNDNWNINPVVAFELTRIVQEALTNAAKHAYAQQIVVTLRRWAASPAGRRVRKKAMLEVECCIEDDGVGFSPEAQHGSD